MRESTLERRLVREVEHIGGKAPKWVSPGNRGVPDRIVILPSGQTVYVEMKAPGKQLQPLQVHWAKILQQLGHRVYKIDSIESIKKIYCRGDNDLWSINPTNTRSTLRSEFWTHRL